MPAFRVNEFDFGVTGHIDFTLIPDSGPAHTYGLNQNKIAPNIGDLIKVQNEDSLTAGPNPNLVSSDTIQISQSDYDAINNQVQADIAASSGGTPYSLVGQNCVDYVQAMMKVGNIPGYVADKIGDFQPLVAVYAADEKSLSLSLPLVHLFGQVVAETLAGFGNGVEQTLELVQSLLHNNSQTNPDPNHAYLGTTEEVIVTGRPDGSVVLSHPAPSDTTQAPPQVVLPDDPSYSSYPNDEAGAGPF